MTTETQGIGTNSIINQDKKQTHKIELLSPKADVLDQTRLRAPSLSFTQQLFKRFGLPNPVCRQHDSHVEERIKSPKSGSS